MTEDRKIIRAEVGSLGLAKQLGNVAQAGGMMGHGRDSLYRFKELHDRGGAPALQEPSRRKPILKDRVAPGIEAAVVRPGDRARPAWGQLRVSNERLRRGLTIAPFGVRGVWGRHDLTTMRHRLKALEAKRMAQERFILIGGQLAALGKAEADEGPRGEFEGERPGYGGAQDTFHVGTLEGVGRGSTNGPSSTPPPRSASPSSAAAGRRSPPPTCSTTGSSRSTTGTGCRRSGS